MREINDAGLALVQRWEGIMDGDPSTVNLDPYLDPVGIWTIGWGHAIRGKDGKFLRGPAAKAEAQALYPEGITRLQAQVLLLADLLDTATDVSRLITVPLTDNQFSALTSFQFNTGRLGNSTLRIHLQARRYAEAADEFPKWNKGRVNGQLRVLPGLTARRAAERRLFLQA